MSFGDLSQMDIKIRYKWLQQQNGRFTILDVPIFRTFEDKERGTVDLAKLRELVHAVHEQEEAGQWLRVFIGHHAGYENRPGVGFMENCRIEGDAVYCDITEIPSEIFSELKQDPPKYPYRSAEYLPASNRLSGLALLESQAPYFVLPILALEPQASAQEEIPEMQRFQLNDNSERRKKIMATEFMEDDDEKKPDAAVLPDENEDKLLGAGEDSEKMRCQAEMGGMNEKLDKIISLLSELLGVGGEEEPSEEEPPAPPADEKENPSSVAYQLRRMNDRLSAIEHGHAMTAQESELKAICEDTGLSFSATRDKLAKFSTGKDRQVFLAALREYPQAFGNHRANAALSPLIGKALNNKESVVAKFQVQGPQAVKTAKAAYETYRETVALGDKRAKALMASFPNAEKFCAHVVEESANDPDYLTKLTQPI